MLLEGKVAIVTGAGRGIGRATAELLAQHGARVVVNDYGVAMDGTQPSSDVAESVAAEIRASGGEAVSHAGSVASESDVVDLVNVALGAFGRIDILVNNAGIIRRDLIVDTTSEQWDRHIEVHLRGSFLCARQVAPLLMKQRSGRIVNITSLAGLAGMVGSNGYGAAKAGMLGLTWLLAQELGVYGVTVNAIAPSAVSRMFEGIPDSVAHLRKVLGLPGGGTMAKVNREPAVVAAMVAYLSADEADYVNGQVVDVDGARIGLWSKPSLSEVAFASEPWTVPALRERFRSTIGRNLSNPIASLAPLDPTE